ncbi:hypothetical protein AVEN_111031-1 [Araneus ventricosus]|uniref:BTB domain-containing protein n=1 Tax=Araneus ventricosus TaxID=182803 RepID=A0A4Y2GD74_ARAVE|nr:hypothetical protein AVEN_111031-1 [Araneus ventricosus]
MADSDSKPFMQIYDVKDIKIGNFSNSDLCRKSGASFGLKRANDQFFLVEVHPNGISPQHQEYVSVEILILPEKARAWSYVNNACLYWTLSVVDLNGSKRCCQSFAIENVVHFPKPEKVTHFLKRSFLLNQADELLPEDVLTVRCELSEIYSTSSVEFLVPKTFDSACFEEGKENSDLKPLGISNIDTARKAQISLELHKICSTMICLKHHLLFPFGMNESYQESIKTMLANDDACDEIRQTYLSSDLTFRVYLYLKEKLRKSLNDGKYNFTDSFSSVIPLVCNDGETQRTTQLTPEPTNDEGKCFSGTVEQDCFLSHKNEKSERTTETDQPLSFDINPFLEILIKNSENIKELIQHILEKQKFYKSTENMCEEQEYKRQTQITSGPLHDEGNCYFRTVGQKCLLSHKDGESETTNKTYRLNDLEMNLLSNSLVKYVESINQFLLVEKRFSEIANVCEERECERKRTIQMTSRSLKDKTKLLSRRIRQICSEFMELLQEQNIHPVSECFLNGQYGECESITETGLPFDLKRDLTSKWVKKYRKEALEIFQQFHGNEEHEFDNDSTAKNQTTWNLYIETMDSILFTIPFEDCKETLGSKLISSSVVFERMLRTPMREKLEKRATLGDIDCRTFISFLYFLKTKEVMAKTLYELMNIYRMGDKYDVKELMLLCAERMQPLFSLSTSMK